MILTDVGHVEQHAPMDQDQPTEFEMRHAYARAMHEAFERQAREEQRLRDEAKDRDQKERRNYCNR